MPPLPALRFENHGQRRLRPNEQRKERRVAELKRFPFESMANW